MQLCIQLRSREGVYVAMNYLTQQLPSFSIFKILSQIILPHAEPPLLSHGPLWKNHFYQHM